MSAINKKPFLVSLIESLSEEQISTLKAMINGEGNQTVLMRTMHVKPLGGRTHLTAADKGIHRCNLEVDFSLLNGYLIYTDDYCVLICYTDFQTLSWYNLDLEKMNANTISEELTILELRSELDDSSAAEKAEIIDTVNEAVAAGDIKVVSLANGTNFNNLGDALLNSLKAGDIVTKEDETGKHAYVVSYKKDGTGICLTYSDAGYSETVSYDYVGEHWVYNSTDVVHGKTVEANPNENADGELTKIKIGDSVKSVGDSLGYLTTAPTEANTSGRLKFVVLNAEPATKYDGYIYLITEE